MKEIHDGIDEGLVNLRQEFIIKANTTPGFIDNMVEYNPLNILVEEISAENALKFKETYSTSKIYFPTELEYEEVRMLTTAFYCSLNNRYYQLQIFTSTVESDDMIKNILYLLIALWLVLSFVFIFVGKQVINKSNKPFRKLLSELEKFQLNNTKMIQFEPTNINEYRQLNQTIENLLRENIQAFVNQKNFIENTSHELQTPLAIAINKMELILNNDKDLNQEQLEEINSALQLLYRMKKLNSALLLLAKIKNKQFADSTIDLFAIFEEVLSNFESLIEYKDITLKIEYEASPVVSMNIDLAYILASNLIKNAIYHNAKDGTITILFAKSSITISNNGQSLGEADEHMFDRYFSTSNNSQSTGLGLSIVKSIVDRYHFTITYHYTDKHIIKLTL
jgi:signal transduction histidine kinase